MHSVKLNVIAISFSEKTREPLFLRNPTASQNAKISAIERKRGRRRPRIFAAQCCGFLTLCYPVCGNYHSGQRCSVVFWQHVIRGKGDTMSKHLSITSVAAFILIGLVVIASGTSAASAQQYQVGAFPITPLQMKVLQPSATIREEQRLSRQPTMNASRAGVRDFSIAGQSGS